MHSLQVLSVNFMVRKLHLNKAVKNKIAIHILILIVIKLIIIKYRNICIRDNHYCGPRPDLMR